MASPDSTSETPVDAPEAATDAAPVSEVPSGAESASAAVSEGAGETSDADAPDDSEPTGKGKAAREAAKYRTQLRETEAKLGDALQTLENMRAEIVSNLAESAGLVNGSELNVPVSELLNETTGLVDADKVRAAVAALTAEKPYLKRDMRAPHQRGLHELGTIINGDGTTPSFLQNDPGKSWSGLMNG